MGVRVDDLLLFQRPEDCKAAADLCEMNSLFSQHTLHLPSANVRNLEESLWRYQGCSEFHKFLLRNPASLRAEDSRSDRDVRALRRRHQSVVDRWERFPSSCGQSI